MSTATKKPAKQSKSQPKAKPAPKAPAKKPKQQAVNAVVQKQPKPAKPAKPEKPAFSMTEEEKAASDAKFYDTAEQHGLATENPRTGKRLSRFIIQAHALAQCWPMKPQTPAEIAANCTQRFGIKITPRRVERQLIDEVRCGRVVAKGKGFVRVNGQSANYWSLAETESEE